ncbi:MAG: transglycosylase domain-containing protein, partial [Alistipes sp.]|nr:transglycosylase domain-containing protein [Candidatus Minthomonas equi]
MEEYTGRHIRKWIWIIVFAPIAVLLLYLLCIGLFARIPSFEELEDPKSNAATELISEDGEILCTYHIENRMFISYDEISPNVINAAVATEDVRFYEHSGIDFRSLLRVGVKTLAMRHASSGGGSTLTQQLAKSLFPRDTADASGLTAKIRLINTKFKEWITALKLERNYTKNEIITMYLNTILFGRNSFGIKSASETFFSKEPSDLNIQEAATLVGMVNKPTRYNPVLNYDRSLERRNHVLSQMNKYDFITDEVCDSLKALPIDLDYNVRDHNSGSAPYFRDMLRRTMNAKYPERSQYYYEEDYLADMESWKDDPLYGWLNKNFKPDGSKYNLDKDGLKIFVTINSKMQRYAEEAVREQLGQNLQPVFFNEMRHKPHRPFARNVPVSVISDLMANARRWSDRYRGLKKEGASEQEILEDFDRKVQMRVFSWNGKGYIDTLMSPNDSIRYYKSFLRAAFIAMEPSTGYVKAYVGGPNYRYFKYDNAGQGKRQVGSTIKPFLYTLAMQEGY